MKRNDRSKALAASLVAALGVALLGPTSARTGDDDVDLRQIDGQLNHGAGHSANRIAGLWNVTVSLTHCATGQTLPFPGATFEALALFGPHGTFHDTNANNPTVRSAAFGSWKHTGRRNYQFAFRFFRFDVTGLNIGSQIVRHNVVLAADGRSYTSKGNAEFYDVSGLRMLPDGCSTSTATRFE